MYLRFNRIKELQWFHMEPLTHDRFYFKNKRNSDGIYSVFKDIHLN